jgi:hypothetical protein
MDISDSHKQALVKEIKFIVKKMDENRDAFSKLYYFSGIFGFLNRLLNQEYHPDLVIAHLIFKTAHKEFMTRLQLLVKEPDKTIQITDEQFKKLSVLSKEFGKKIEKNEDIFDTLTKITVLTYSTSGNGFYLMQKGILKI